MRQAKALCVVVALILSVPVFDAVLCQADAHRNESEPLVGIDATALADAGNAENVLDRLELLTDQDGSVPSWFEWEVGYVPGARDVRASGSVVGYVVDGESAEVMGKVETLMAARGWTGVPLSGVEGATFMKPSGTCTWALVTCTQVGDAASVVIRCNAV